MNGVLSQCTVRLNLAGFSSVCDLNISCNILLYGSEMLDYQINCKVFDVVHSYIESTERL